MGRLLAENERQNPAIIRKSLSGPSTSDQDKDAIVSSRPTKDNEEEPSQSCEQQRIITEITTEEQQSLAQGM